MAKNDNLKDFLTDVADAIREKKGTDDLINPQDFSTEIANLPSGGDDDYAAKVMIEGTEYIANQAESITIGKGINALGPNCFKDYPKLKECILPEGLNRIEYNAFRNCSSLEFIVLPKSLVTVNNSIFESCISLQAITIPEKVEALGNYVFNGCTSLEKVILLVPRVITLYNSNSFKGTPIESGTGYIYVRDELIEGFKAYTNWSTYADQIKGLSELPNE